MPQEERPQEREIPQKERPQGRKMAPKRKTPGEKNRIPLDRVGNPMGTKRRIALKGKVLPIGAKGFIETHRGGPPDPSKGKHKGTHLGRPPDS